MRIKLIVVVIFGFYLSGCTYLSPTETQLAVKELVTQVQVAVNTIRQDSEASSVLPPLKSAELTLSSKAETDTSGKVALFVSAGGGRKQSDANSITMILVPNPAGTKALDKDRGEDIARSVLAAVAGLEDLEELKLKSLTVVATLEVVKNLDGGLEIELSGVSVEAGRKKVLTTGNSLKLTFEEQDTDA